MPKTYWSIDFLWQIEYRPNPNPPTIKEGYWAGHYDPQADTTKPWVVRRLGKKGKPHKHFEDAHAQCKAWNFQDHGLQLVIYGDYSNDRPIPLWDAAGGFVAHLNEPPLNYTFAEIDALPTLEERQFGNLKVKTDDYSVELDRMEVASYFPDDLQIAAAGSLPTRIVRVYGRKGDLVAIYLADGEDDGFMAQRRKIWSQER